MKRAEKIEQLKQQRADLKERIRQADQILRNRQQRLENAERTKKRKLETRRKLLTGAAVIADAKDDPDFQRRIEQARDRRLTQPRDRALFGLPPLDKPTTAPTEPAGKTSALLGSPDSPIPGFRPKKLDDGSWGALFEGDTSILPDELIGLTITVTPKSKSSKPWDTTVSEVLKRTEDWCDVRTPSKPK